MRRVYLAAIGVAVLAMGGPAGASDDKPCPSGLVCASKPDTITSIMKSLEPKVKMRKADDDDPVIDVEGPVYDYEVMFMDCKNRAQCAAVTFSSAFKAEPLLDVDFANRWNREHRIPKAYVDKDGALYLQLEVSTIGGLTRANFRDWKEWWDSGLSDFAKFYDKESDARDPKKKV